MNNLPDWEQEASSVHNGGFLAMFGEPKDGTVMRAPDVAKLARRMFAAGMRYGFKLMECEGWCLSHGDCCSGDHGTKDNTNVDCIADKIESGEL